MTDAATQPEMVLLDQLRTLRNAIRATKNSMSKGAGMYDSLGTSEGCCQDEVASRAGLSEAAALPLLSSPGT